MIPIDQIEAKKAYTEKKINFWELTFVEQVRTEEQITEKQYDTILKIAEKMKPYVLIQVKDPEPRYRDRIDPYFGQRYFEDEY